MTQHLEQVSIQAQSLSSLAGLYGPEEIFRSRQSAEHLRTLLNGGAVWNINSTAHGGGVAEMLRSLVGYARGAGIDCRWAVIKGSEEFFKLTKRVHNALHGAFSDGSLLGEHERLEYERICAANASELLAELSENDVIVLHDPQTLGMASTLYGRCSQLIWRCHVGTSSPNEGSAAAHRFLAPYLQHIQSAVFTRADYVPRGFPVPTYEMTPTIDPLSPKNQDLSSDTVRAILVHTGLLEGPAPRALPEFRLPDGSMTRVDRYADVIQLGRGCRNENEPCVVQISRWDRLKDHLGVLLGFAEYIQHGGAAHLILAGPSVRAVADDPEGAEVFDELLAAYRALPHGIRACVRLVNLPMTDPHENAAIVNALQRHATVVVQKSLQEGFGLTVAEAMWKEKPVIASRVGGIPDQIEHEVSGILLDDPCDTGAFSKALQRLLADPGHAAQLGRNARARVKERFLSLRSLYFYADLIGDSIRPPVEASTPYVLAGNRVGAP
jgi:trehalose synthase